MFYLVREGEGGGSVVEHRTPERERGGGFKTNLRRVVSLSETLYSPKVLVIPRKRWLCPDMTEKLLTGTLSPNTHTHTEVETPKICSLNEALLIYETTNTYPLTCSGVTTRVM